MRAAGTLRPRAIIGVDLFGQPAPWPALRAIARRESLFLLDDLAQSFGASLARQPLGTQGDATATSFFPSKPLGAYGDGGALLTESADRAALYRSLRSHGEGTTRYEVLRTGVNGRLDTLQAAVLLAKLDVFEEELAPASASPRSTTAGCPHLVETPARVPGGTSAWAIYAILLRDEAAARPMSRTAFAPRAFPPRSTTPGRCTSNPPTPPATTAPRSPSPRTSRRPHPRPAHPPRPHRRPSARVCDAVRRAVR